MSRSTDAELVLAVQAGGIDAFEELYLRYFDRVYDFAVRTMRDRDRAADAVQNAFLKAHDRIGQLRKPEAFRAWLFAIVRRESLAEFRRSSREVHTPTVDGDPGLNPLLTAVSDGMATDPVAAAEFEDSATMVWEAAASLDPETYTILDLHVRQGLSSAEIAEVLSISKGSAYTRLNRMKERVVGAIETYLLVRSGSGDCDQLDDIVRPESIPPVSKTLRRRVQRHVRSCEECDARRKRLVAPMEIFAALAAVEPPADLAVTIWNRIGSAAPPSPDDPSRWSRASVAGVVIIVVLVMLVGVLFATVGDLGDGAWETAADDAHVAGATETTEPSISPAAGPSNTVTPASAGGVVARSTPASTTPNQGDPSPAIAEPVRTAPASPPSSPTNPVTTPAPTPTPTTPTATSPPTTTTTTTTTTTLPDQIPPLIGQQTANPGAIWELDELFLSCPPGTARSATISAIVSDAGSGVDTVTASWIIGGSPTNIAMVGNNSLYTAPFGPFSYLTVPDSTAPVVNITVTATDNEGNQVSAFTAVTVHSLGECFI